jgi:hypothetical protein
MQSQFLFLINFIIIYIFVVYSSAGGKETYLDPLHVRFIAGNIIPAVLPTTAVSAGLICLELLKIASISVKNLEKKLGKASIFFSIIVKSASTVMQKIFQNRFIFPRRFYKRENERHFSLAEKDLYKFRNSFVNLATPSVAFCNPVIDNKYLLPTTNELFSQWDVIEVSS